MSAKLSGGEEVIREILDAYEILHSFGNLGTNETTFLAALGSRAEYVLALHELSAVGSAAGHATVTRRPAVVNIHTYPLHNTRKTLKVTPVMAAGLSPILWSMGDVAALIDAAAPKPGKRRSDKPHQPKATVSK